MFKIKILFLILLSFLLVNIGYGAECSFGLCKVDPVLTNEGGNNIGLTIINLIKFLLGFIGLISVIFVFKGGFSILTASSDDEKIKNGKKTILFALLGIFIISISWVIVDGFILILEKK